MIDLNLREKQLVFMNALFQLGSTLGSVFVNVFVYEYTKSLELTVIYACCRYLMIPIFSLVAGKLNIRHQLTNILSTGLALMVVAYIALLVIGSGIGQAVWKAFIIAAVTGCGEGLFWFAMNVMNQNTARVEVRGLFLSNIGFLNGIASIAAPIISAFILRYTTSDMFGYAVIFGCVIAIFVVVVYVSMGISYEYYTTDFKVIPLLKKGSEKWEFQKRTTLYNSIREVYVLILASLLVYRALDNSGEFLSIYNAVTSILLIVAYQYFGKRVQGKQIMSAFYVGSIGLIMSMFILSFTNSVPFAFLYGAVYAIATPLYGVGYQMTRMKIYAEEAKDGIITGHIIVIELLINIGRILSLGLVVVLAQILSDPLYIEVATVFMALGGIALMVSTKRLSKKYELL